MARRVRQHRDFTSDLAAQIRWLARNRPPEQRKNLRTTLAAFKERLGAHPGLGREVELRGTLSYRALGVGEPLPYVVWYSYDTEAEDAPVSLLMLLHESQDRERFSPAGFE